MLYPVMTSGSSSSMTRANSVRIFRSSSAWSRNVCRSWPGRSTTPQSVKMFLVRIAFSMSNESTVSGGRNASAGRISRPASVRTRTTFGTV